MIEHVPVVLDTERLAALEDELGDALVVRDAVRSFIDELPARLAAIRSAIEAGDADASRDRAHALGSPAAMLGAVSVRRATREIEKAGRSGADADLDALYGELDATCTLTVDALRRYLATPLPG